MCQSKCEKCRTFIESLKRKHFVNEDDGWYSCPMSGHCIADELGTDICNCGALQHNKKIDDFLRDIEDD